MHEQELRAIVWNPPLVRGQGFNLEAPRPEPGFYISVELHDLIEEVRVSPKSAPWYKVLVEKILGKYAFDSIPVNQSALDDAALF